MMIWGRLSVRPVFRMRFEPLTDKKPVRQIGAANLIAGLPGDPKGEARSAE